MIDEQIAAEPPEEAVAIIGMDCRVPGADDVDAFWRNLCDGVESITVVDTRSHPSGQRRVGARGVLQQVDEFDASFFGMSAREAALTDPQSRLFLECAWTALERAGYDTARFDGTIGVYGGAGPSGYLLHQVARSDHGGLSDMSVVVANDKDHLTTRVAYKLGLTGPAITVQTACSTSLVAVQLAWQALLGYQCDIAIAGGVSIAFPLDIGYEYQEGFILSPDGHCRAFDARAQGTVPGDGVGIVVLKRLSEALADGDHIHAVILGAAINNDGVAKTSYTAPSIQGQARVIAMAHAVADISADSIGFVEAHGTGTQLGDPIEVAALTEAFRESSQRKGFCALGSVKPNIGHLNTAAGIVSLIKATLAVEHGLIPASLHFREPNPAMALEQTPFFVNASTRPWRDSGPSGRRRAGVSSFGFGGTNAHVILEQAPASNRRASSPPHHLLLLSARTETGLEMATQLLRAQFARAPDIDVADVAFTLQLGRRAFPVRRMLVCRDWTDAVHALGEPGRWHSAVATESPPGVIFMLPGQGVQYPGMGYRLYQSLPIFRRHFDEARTAFRQHTSRDLLELIDPRSGSALQRTEFAQPAIAAVIYALARMWMTLGVRPTALVGNSLGEYVAACLAGALSLTDMARLIAARGRLMQGLPAGAMVSVPLSEREIRPHLDDGLVVAAVLAPTMCVAAGTPSAIDKLCVRLQALGIEPRRVAVQRAFHSPMMASILEPFRAEAAQVAHGQPVIPRLSGLTGSWVDEARDSSYWVAHLLQTNRMGKCLARIGDRIPLEVGPGRSMSALAARVRGPSAAASVITSMGRPGDDEYAAILTAAGQLFLQGIAIEWQHLYRPGSRRRIALPTYPFERDSYFIDGPPSPLRASGNAAQVEDERRFLDRVEREIHAALAIQPIRERGDLARRLDEWCASEVIGQLRDHGVDITEGAFIEREELSTRLGVLARFERLLDAMLDMLEADGMIRSQDDGIYFTDAAGEARSSVEIRTELERRHPQFAGIYRFLAHCSQSRHEAMVGGAEAIGVLFPGGSSALVDECEQATAEYRSERIYIRLMCAAVTRMAARAHGRTLRILEVGGGRGLLTFPLVEALLGYDIEYHFTDLGRVFVDDARAEATRRGLQDVMRFGVFDITREWGAQGYEENGFDLIVAYNVIHATADVRDTMQRLARLLTPDGTLAVIEIVSVHRWDTLTWGLAEGWWYYSDDWRQGSPLLALDSWEALATDCGFARVEAYPRDPIERANRDHGLLLARRERTPFMRLTEPDRHMLSAAAPSERRQRMSTRDRRHPRPDVEQPYVAPRTAAEKIVADVFAQALGLEQVGVQDDVFHLGADSLIMLRVTDRLRQELGRDVPAHLAFRGATVESLASALAGASAGERGQVADTVAIPLQPHGSQRPLFFVHPAAGVVFPYVELSRQMGADRPFYGLQASGLDGGEAPDATIAQMAQRYVEAMLHVQPAGPYYVGGFSFGCFVAFEVAQTLVRQGRTVELVALVDEPAPIEGRRPPPWLMGRLLVTGIGRSIWPHLHDYFYLSRSARADAGQSILDVAALLRRTSEGGWLETFLARSTMANYVPRESRLLALRQPAMLPMFRLFTQHLQESYAYTPRAYPGRVTLFKATRLGRRYERDPTWGWSMLAAGGVDVFDVPGEHLTVLRKPNVQVLAKRLASCMQAADRRIASAAGDDPADTRRCGVHEPAARIRG